MHGVQRLHVGPFEFPVTMCYTDTNLSKALHSELDWRSRKYSDEGFIATYEYLNIGTTELDLARNSVIMTPRAGKKPTKPRLRDALESMMISDMYTQAIPITY